MEQNNQQLETIQEEFKTSHEEENQRQEDQEMNIDEKPVQDEPMNNQ
jgi:hypothetical protein